VKGQGLTPALPIAVVATVAPLLGVAQTSGATLPLGSSTSSTTTLRSTRRLPSTTNVTLRGGFACRAVCFDVSTSQ